MSCGYNGVARGDVYNEDRYKQLVDYSGVRYGNITPTDIDGFIEYHDEIYVFYELKHMGGKMPHGQQMALENLANCVKRAGRSPIIIVADHDTPTNQKVDAASTIVRCYYSGGEWRYPSKQIGRDVTLKELTDAFMKHNGADAVLYDGRLVEICRMADKAFYPWD
jgi:hypothetical protein